jgi:very-short-patch-repair endonuclease
LLQDAGYRRLNVAITRAKRRMTLVSSFAGYDIDLKRSGARGVAMLKAYLDYTANGGSRFVGTERADEIALNSFEADIRDALERRGVALRSQFGALRFRIDLVAMHPERIGQPVLAIECDGATYHSSTTARDRDRIRQKQLERLGWVFHRVWSTDWFRSRETEIERALEAYRAAVRRSDQGVGMGPQPVAPGRAAASGTAPITAPPARPVRSRGPRPVLDTFETIEDYTDAELHELFVWIASDGLNRLDEEILDEARTELNFKRMGSRIRAHLSASLARWKKLSVD